MAKRKPVCLALQGGGSHGAFQWGVLDRLFEDDRIEVTAVTAASAGAMNAAALVTGLAKDGNAGARVALEQLWHEVNQSGGRNVFGSSGQWIQSLTKQWVNDNPLWQASQTLAMSMSPYAFNPFNLNPLKRVIETVIDFDAVRGSGVRMHISATAVQSGKSRIFETAEISPDVLLASACLPHMFQAVRIDDEDYWDGGYLANPALYPLFEDQQPHDILLLPLNPFRRDDTPQQSAEIMDRLNEILFNAPLVAELRSIAFVQKLIEEGRLVRGEGWSEIRLHAIPADQWLGDLSLASKMDTEKRFLTTLKDKGRQAADQWLETCFPRLGKSTTVDLQAEFL